MQYGGDAALTSIQDAVIARRAAEAHEDADDSESDSNGASDSVSELGDGRLTAVKRALGSATFPARAIK